MGGRVREVTGGASFKAVPARDWEDIGRDRQGNLWIADIGNNECRRTDTALLKVREPDPAAAGPGPGPTNVEGVAFGWGGHDLNLLAENRDVFFVPAGAYER